MSNQTEIDGLRRQLALAIQAHWKLFLAQGILMMVLGFLAVAEPNVATVSMVNVFTATSNLGEVGVSRFLPARFHAHLILRFARRPGIILHASPLLVAAYLAAGLLSLCCIVGSIKPSKYQQR